jgi:dihydrofolate synthase/folylpolyglutamate synthase
MPDHARSDHPAVQAQLNRFAQLSPGRDILGLERISALMAVLGNPHLRLPPVFHVAGTNGKGSTCAFLRFMLEAAGYNVHVYTSPHLVRFNERIRLAGTLISDEALAPLLAEVLDAAEAGGIGPSFFEATTAVAFLAFTRTPADACVIEVGLGGRLDATNVIDQPLVCGIAQLGVDHQAFLGDDAVTIAGEKAGIAKAGVPLVTLAYPEAETARIAAVAAAAGAHVLIEGRDWEAGQHKLALPGAFQQHNAALAVAMLLHQTALAVPDDAIRQGLAAARWPARLQQLKPGSLVRDGQEVWLDGCHNPAGAALIAAHFNDGRPLHLICGILANKDAAGILAPFMGIAQHLSAVPIIGHEHYAADDVAQIACLLGMNATAAPNVAEALAHTKSQRTLIMGSLYLASEVLTLNEEWPE